MKPKHNMVYCNGCGRRKMLFESKSKADNFIKFNQEVILEEKGYAPVRSYYCEFCGGYHVTSNSSTEIGERLDAKEHQLLTDLTSQKINDIDFNSYYSDSLDKVAHAEKLMYSGDFSLIASLHKEMEDLRIKHKILFHLPLQKKEKLLDLNQKINSLSSIAMEVLKIVKGDVNKYLSETQPTEDNQTVFSIVKGLRLMVYVLTKIDMIQDLIDKGDVLKAHEVKEELRNYVREAKVNKVARTTCNIKISKLEPIIARKRREIQEANSKDEREIPFALSPREKRLNKSVMVEVIDILEEIKECYDRGDIETCQTKLEVADFIFSTIQIEDPNTQLIKTYIDNWKQVLS